MWTKLIIAVGIFLLVVLASAKKVGDARDLKRRVEAIKRRQNTTPKTVQEMSSLRRTKQEKRDLAYWLLKPLPDSKKIEELLNNAGVKMNAKQFIFKLSLFTIVIILFITVIMKKPLLLGILVGVVFGVWFPFKFLKRRIRKQQNAFLLLFPEAIELITRGLKAGLPVAESIVQVSTELAEPVRSTFGNVSNTMKLGVPLEKALQETAKKLELREFHFFTTSIILQRETGGNLSEILGNLAEVLRTRYIMKMKITALTSEARASATIIGSLPFLVTGAITFIRPEYIAPLFETEGGNQALAVAICMLGFGIWVMNRMTKFEI